MTNRRQTPPAPKPADPKPEPQVKAPKVSETRPCGCGCGELTPRRFRPGHDARVPLGATCQPADGDCDATATFALGKVPVCDAHLAARVRDVDGARVRVLAAPPAAQAQAS